MGSLIQGRYDRIWKLISKDGTATKDAILELLDALNLRKERAWNYLQDENDQENEVISKGHLSLFFTYFVDKARFNREVSTFMRIVQP